MISPEAQELLKEARKRQSDLSTEIVKRQNEKHREFMKLLEKEKP